MVSPGLLQGCWLPYYGAVGTARTCHLLLLPPATCLGCHLSSLANQIFIPGPPPGHLWNVGRSCTSVHTRRYTRPPSFLYPTHTHTIHTQTSTSGDTGTHTRARSFLLTSTHLHDHTHMHQSALRRHQHKTHACAWACAGRHSWASHCHASPAPMGLLCNAWPSGEGPGRHTWR